MNKAIISKWECPSCGNVIKYSEVFTVAPSTGRHSFSGPKKCGCGRKGLFRLLTFESASATIVSDKEIDEELVAGMSEEVSEPQLETTATTE